VNYDERITPLSSKTFRLNLNRSTNVEYILVLQCHQLEDGNMWNPTHLQGEINIRNYCAYVYEHMHLPASETGRHVSNCLPNLPAGRRNPEWQCPRHSCLLKNSRSTSVLNEIENEMHRGFSCFCRNIKQPLWRE
jgi:hypothetical protein